MRKDSHHHDTVDFLIMYYDVTFAQILLCPRTSKNVPELEKSVPELKSVPEHEKCVVSPNIKIQKSTASPYRTDLYKATHSVQFVQPLQVLLVILLCHDQNMKIRAKFQLTTTTTCMLQKMSDSVHSETSPRHRK